MPNTFLRRYEVQIAYDTAFLYMNTNGAIAERWGHGPYFSAWSEVPGQVTLTEGPNDQSIVGAIGIRASALIYHNPHTRKAATDLAVEFLGDCLGTFKPGSIKRIINKQAWILEAKHADGLNQALVKAFPNVDSIVPADYNQSYSGVSYNAEKDWGDGGTMRSNAAIGIYPKDVAGNFFGMVTDDDPELALGALIELTVGYEEGRPAASVVAELPGMLTSFDADADYIVSKTLRRFESNA